MTDLDFWLEVRRGLITIGKAIARRYGWHALVILLGCKEG